MKLSSALLLYLFFKNLQVTVTDYVTDYNNGWVVSLIDDDNNVIAQISNVLGIRNLMDKRGLELIHLHQNHIVSED